MVGEQKVNDVLQPVAGTKGYKKQFKVTKFLTVILRKQQRDNHVYLLHRSDDFCIANLKETQKDPPTTNMLHFLNKEIP